MGHFGPDANEAHFYEDCKVESFTLDSRLQLNNGKVCACSKVVNDSVKWGFIIDDNCIEFLPFTFTKARNFECGLAPVSKGNLWGAIDTSGNLKIPYKYFDLHKFYDSLATFTDASKKWGVISINQDTIIKPTYEYISDFFSNISLAQNKDLSWIVINSKGGIVPIKIDSLVEGYYCKVKHCGDFPFDYKVKISGTYLNNDQKEIVVFPVYSNGKKQTFVSFDNKFSLMSDSIHIGIIRNDPECLSKADFKSIY